ncbi:hypothetical protein ACFL4N_08490 [Thermodesulfobacteriota bacterium]
MGDIEVEKWVMTAGKDKDHDPTQEDYPGSSYGAPIQDRLIQKTIAGFYRICASDGFTKENIEAYLIKKKIGNEGDKLSEKDWKKIE